ncbi:MAG TPA: response regulator [Myxococcota bacterium]|nr:response regulator [Myxococcota bacterium]
MGKTLLLADDSVTIQKVVGISFASEDIALVTVDNGDDAIAKARALRPDVILADVVMPGKSGYEVCEAIKADPALRHIPVLLLTGTFEAFDSERAGKAGAAGHIAKPFEAQALVERVKRLLASAPAPAPAAPQPQPVAAAQPAAAARPAAMPVPPQPTTPNLPPAAARPAAPKPAARSEDAFDFFDESVAQPAAHARTATAESQLASSSSSGSNLNFDGGDDNAFAFGDDDLGTTPAPSRASAAARTVAILPNAPPVESEDAFALDAEAEGPDELELATPPPIARPAAPVRPALDEAERFDFEFGGGGGEEREDAGAVPNAAVLDPIAGSEYDVSSSDLSAMVGDKNNATRLLEPEPAVQHARIGEDPVMDLLEGDLDEGEAELAADPAEDTYDRLPKPQPQRAAAPARPDDLEDTLEPAQVERLRQAPAPPLREPTLPARPAAASSDAAIADAALARVAPALRAQLHDTLEKMAWEAFGSAAETIIQQAVERLEKVAWEVVPRLAETLIQEEIRKLKGGDEDDEA